MVSFKKLGRGRQELLPDLTQTKNLLLLQVTLLEINTACLPPKMLTLVRLDGDEFPDLCGAVSARLDSAFPNLFPKTKKTIS